MDTIKRVLSINTVQKLFGTDSDFKGIYMQYANSQSRNILPSPHEFRITRFVVSDDIDTFYGFMDDSYSNYTPLFSYSYTDKRFSCVRSDIELPENPEQYQIGRPFLEVQKDFRNDILSTLVTTLFHPNGSANEEEFQAVKTSRDFYAPEEYLSYKHVCQCLLYAYKNPHTGLFDFLADFNELEKRMATIDFSAEDNVRSVSTPLLAAYEFSKNKQSTIYQCIGQIAMASDGIIPICMRYMHDIYLKSRILWKKASRQEQETYCKVVDSCSTVENTKCIVIVNTHDGKEILYPNTKAFLERLSPQELMPHFRVKKKNCKIPFASVTKITCGEKTIYHTI